MSRKNGNAAIRWAGAAAVATLSVVCLVLLGGQVAAAQGSPAEEFESLRAEPAGADALVMETGTGWAAGPRQLDPGITVDLTYDAVWGVVDPGAAIVVARTTDGAYGAAEADGVGFFWTPLWQTNGRPADVAAGQTIQVYVNGSLAASPNPKNVTGSIDVLADQVAGTLSGDTGGTEVTLSVGVEGQQPGDNAPQQTVSTNGIGSFAATFAAVNLGPSTLVAVEYANGGATVRTYLYPSPHVFLVQNMSSVQGYADPGQQVEVTCYQGAGPAVRWSASGQAEWPHGWYEISSPYPSHAEAADVVEVDVGGGSVLTTIVADMSVTGVNPALDQVVGTAPPGAAVTVGMRQLGGYVQTTGIADGNGDFTATFATADVRPRDEIRVSVADDEGNVSQLLSGAPYIEVLLNPVSNWDCVLWRVNGPDLPVTLSLQTSSGLYTRPGLTSSAGNGSSPYCHVIRNASGTPVNFAPGDTLTVQAPTWQGSLVIADISWEAETADDQVSGNAPPGDLEVWAHQWYADRYPIQGSAVRTGAGATPYSVSFTGFDVRDGGWIEIRHFDPATDFVTHPNVSWLGILPTQYFEVGIYGTVRGVAPGRDEMVNATLYSAGGVELASTSDDWDGDPWGFELYFGDETRIEPGHWVTVTSESGWTAGLKVPELTVSADEDTELIWGEGPKSLLFVSVGWSSELFGRFVPADGYVVDTAFWGYDLHKFDHLVARSQARNGDRVSQVHEWPRMEANYGLDEAAGIYDVGHTFWITVTDGGGTAKAHATATTAPSGTGPDFAWSNGFWVHKNDWSNPTVDIRPGDWLHYRADDGYTNSVRVGTITARLNAAANTAAGTITAPGFAEPLECGAGFWGQFWKAFTVDPNGGSYLVDFSPYDLQPGERVSVVYWEPDGDAVLNVFRVPRALVYLPVVLRKPLP